MSWTEPEATAIAQLEAEGFTSVSARVMTAMVARRYARERSKLIDILSFHTGLEDVHAVEDSLQSLLRQELVTAVDYDGASFLGAAPEVVQRLEDTSRAAAAGVLQTLLSTPVRRLESLGPMTDVSVLRSLESAIAGARRGLRLVFLTSDANIEAITALERRARAGVRVQILLGAPDTVAAIRGSSAHARATRAIQSWKTKTADWPNTEIRIAREAGDLDCASSLSADGELLRLDVHEPLAERSLMGEMVVAHPGGGNMIRLFDRYFDAAWERAVRIRRRDQLAARALSFRWTVATLLLLPLAFWLTPSEDREVVAGIAVGALFAALDENRGRLAVLWRRLRAARG